MLDVRELQADKTCANNVNSERFLRRFFVVRHNMLAIGKIGD